MRRRRGRALLAWVAFGVVMVGFATGVSACYAPHLVELRTPALTLTLLFVMITQSWMSGRTKGAK